MVMETEPVLEATISGEVALRGLGFTVRLGASVDGYLGLGGDDEVNGELVASASSQEPTVETAGNVTLIAGVETTVGPGFIARKRARRTDRPDRQPQRSRRRRHPHRPHLPGGERCPLGQRDPGRRGLARQVGLLPLCPRARPRGQRRLHRQSLARPRRLRRGGGVPDRRGDPGRRLLVGRRVLRGPGLVRRRRPELHHQAGLLGVQQRTTGGGRAGLLGRAVRRLPGVPHSTDEVLVVGLRRQA